MLKDEDHHGRRTTVDHLSHYNLCDRSVIPSIVKIDITIGVTRVSVNQLLHHNLSH